MLKHVANMAEDGRLSCASSTGVDLGRVNVTGFMGIDGSGGLQMTYNTEVGLSVQSSVTSAQAGTAALLGMPHAGGREQKVDVHLKYRGDPWQVHASVEPVARKWAVACVARYPLGNSSVAAGVDVSGSATAPPVFSGAALAYAFPTKGHTVTGCLAAAPFRDHALGKLSVAVASQQTNHSEMAARYTYTPATDKTELCLGGGWLLDTKTKLTSLKVKINQEGILAAAVTHKLNPNASLTVGAS
ncbi:eukaryotic porin, partial [Gregarina niphandrodes]